jgi:hypothetical protein
MPAMVALTLIATTAWGQHPMQRPHITGPTGGGSRIKPCSRLRTPGSCSPGASTDVIRYIPPPRSAQSGGLRLEIRPASATVSVDGRYAGLVSDFDGDAERLVLTPGSHSLLMQATGYEPLEIVTMTRAGYTTIYRGALSPAPPAAQIPNGFAPIDVRAPAPPRALLAGGQTSLVYELHVTSVSSQSLTLEAVDVMDRAAVDGEPPLLHLEGAAVQQASRLIGEPPESAETSVVAAGRTVVVFVWMALPSSAVIPAALTHRFTVKMAGKEGPTVVVPGIDVQVSAQKAPVIGPPLEGDHWLAANGPDNGSHHRRALIALTAEARIAQRFAIDWVRLFENGRTVQGDPRDNASYRAFGAKVLAVADGVVLETVDGLPENVPDPVARAVPITPATVSGNYILLDIGGDAYAVYAHLQPGSLRVKKGDRVRRGQTLALLGNTGNSTEPHLHFHISDRPSALDSEGIPYALSSFGVEADPQVITPALGPLGGSLEINSSGLAAWKGTMPRLHKGEMPLLNTIVTFPNR